MKIKKGILNFSQILLINLLFVEYSISKFGLSRVRFLLTKIVSWKLIYLLKHSIIYSFNFVFICLVRKR